MLLCSLFSSFFFFNDTATTEIYTLSLHDALPISFQVDLVPVLLQRLLGQLGVGRLDGFRVTRHDEHAHAVIRDRKSTRLNSSHLVISYAVFCLKKKKKNNSYFDDCIQFSVQCTVV